MMIPRKLHRIWLGGSMPQEFQRFGEALAALHPAWEIRTWSEEDLQWLENSDLFRAASTKAEQADIARYEIVRREGGIYLDTDFEPLQPFDSLLEGDNELILAEERSEILVNSFFGAVPDSPFLTYLIAELRISLGAGPERPPNEASGPHFFTRCVRRWRAVHATKCTVLARDRLFPVGPAQFPLTVAPSPSTLAIHHWAHSWRPTPLKPVRNTLRSRLRRLAQQLKLQAVGLQQRWDRLEPRAEVPRQSVDATYVGDRLIMVNTVHGYPIRAFSQDLNITASLLSTGTYDPAFHHFLERELQPWDVVVDVGANIGLFTIAAGRTVGFMGRVIAFEPNPSTCSLLRQNVYMNQMLGLRAEIAIIQSAVGAESATADLAYSDSDPGRANMMGGSVGGPATTVEVEVVRLDDALEHLHEIRLLKIDVEGRELAALQGASRLVAERRIRLLDIELVDTHAGAGWPDLEQLLVRFVDEFGAKSFLLNQDGTRFAISLDEALHSDSVSHLLFEFPRAEAVVRD